MPTVTIHAAKATLSELLARIEADEAIGIARGGKPTAKLVPLKSVLTRRFGAMRGLISLDDAVFDPLPEAQLKAWA
jgi:prevent-host-death family protein